MEYPYGVIKETNYIPIQFPPQHQEVQPGLEWAMRPNPISEDPRYKGSKKLNGKVAVITGGDSGIGRAISIAYAKEGADIVIVYYNEHFDAQQTKKRVEELGRNCMEIACDLGDPEASTMVVNRTIQAFGKIDILVNNCAMQFVQESLLDITNEQLYRTFQSNIFSYIFLTREALPYLREGSTIINTASIVAFMGHEKLIDYSATKGAVVSFTRAIAKQLAEKGIRVNGIAPGPIWTPLIPASFSASDVMTFGYQTAMNRAGQPYELAPVYVYLASKDSTYVTGQILHVNGGHYPMD